MQGALAGPQQRQQRHLQPERPDAALHSTTRSQAGVLQAVLAAAQVRILLRWLTSCKNTSNFSFFAQASLVPPMPLSALPLAHTRCLYPGLQPTPHQLTLAVVTKLSSSDSRPSTRLTHEHSTIAGVLFGHLGTRGVSFANDRSAAAAALAAGAGVQTLEPYRVLARVGREEHASAVRHGAGRVGGRRHFGCQAFKP